MNHRARAMVGTPMIQEDGEPPVSTHQRNRQPPRRKKNRDQVDVRTAIGPPVSNIRILNSDYGIQNKRIQDKRVGCQESVNRNRLSAEKAAHHRQGSTAPVGSCGNHQISTTEAVTPGVDLGVAGQAAGRINLQLIPAITSNPHLCQFRNRGDIKAEGKDDDIRGDAMGAVGDDFDALATIGVLFCQPRLFYLDAEQTGAFAADFPRADVEVKNGPFFDGILKFLVAARHVGFVAAIEAGDLFGTVAQRSAQAVHGGIAASDNYNPFALHHKTRIGGFAEQLLLLCDQIVHRQHDFRQIFTDDAGLATFCGADADEYRIVIVDQLRVRDLFANLLAQMHLQTGLLKQVKASGDDFFVQFETGNTVGQQTTGMFCLLVHGHADTGAQQEMGAGDARWTGANNSDTGVVAYPREGQLHPGVKGEVSDGRLNGPDGDGPVAVIQGAGALAQMPLGTDAAENLGKRGAFVGQTESPLQVAVGDGLKPLGDVVLQWAADGGAKRIATLNAALRLLANHAAGEKTVDLVKVLQPLGGFKFFRLLAAGFGKTLHRLIPFFRIKRCFHVLGGDHPEIGQLLAEIVEDRFGNRARRAVVITDQDALQVEPTLVVFIDIDTPRDHQLLIETIDKVLAAVVDKSSAAGHAGTEVDPGLAEDDDSTTGHIFAGMITGSFNHRQGAGISHAKALTGSAGNKEFAAGGPIKAGVADR